MTSPQVTFTFNEAGLDRLYRSSNSIYAERYLVRVGNQIVNQAKARANVDTGLMRSTIQFRLIAGSHPPAGEVVARTKYAKFIHDGTRFYSGNPFLLNATRDVIR